MTCSLFKKLFSSLMDGTEILYDDFVLHDSVIFTLQTYVKILPFGNYCLILKIIKANLNMITNPPVKINLGLNVLRKEAMGTTTSIHCSSQAIR